MRNVFTVYTGIILPMGKDGYRCLHIPNKNLHICRILSQSASFNSPQGASHGGHVDRTQADVSRVTRLAAEQVMNAKCKGKGRQAAKSKQRTQLSQPASMSLKWNVEMQTWLNIGTFACLSGRTASAASHALLR